MPDTALSLEQIVSGIVGLLLLGGILKKGFDGYLETKKQLATNSMSSGTTSAMLTAVSVQWTRDQQERIIQSLERIAVALESSSSSQKHIADQHMREFDSRVNALLEELRRAETIQRRR